MLEYQKPKIKLQGTFRSKEFIWTDSDWAGGLAIFLLLPQEPDRGLETGKFHSMIHLLWKKGAFGNSLQNTVLRGKNNKVTGEK